VAACTAAAVAIVRAVEGAYADGTLVTVENGGTAGTADVTSRVFRCLDRDLAAAPVPA
jgi:hypothetical protein